MFTLIIGGNLATEKKRELAQGLLICVLLDLVTVLLACA